MIKHSAYALGATLYMPATRPDILDVVMGEKIHGLRSLVVCLEDAVAETDVQQALNNLKNLLLGIDARGGRPPGSPMVFVRPRDAAMAAVLNDWSLMRYVDGFVVPKLRLSNIHQWQQAVTRDELMLMPTLETPEVYDPSAMVELRGAMLELLPERIIALRIGGNDLMGCLGLRRNPAMTLYSTPMSYVIPMLCGIMGSAGFALTAPVFEQLNAPQLLEHELALDLAHGLVGKTAIHPSQIAIIHNALQVSLEDLTSARHIVSEAAPAVFKFNDAMCEPATHYTWAQKTIERAHWQGVRPECSSADIFGGSLRLAEVVG
ncbi:MULTISPECIES: HpcH/HpaI aldolase/citrate lyase family protein [Pseudomonas]|uniref:HpcH/HpaI aldolase/citrate lyase family protein n=1 Tax=Pseudomonas saxonica TaxID=2600598 RepID=A0ABY3GDC1_9PSED|nr:MULTISPECIES: HpcH/HpaI aldolase/citrate lyase family protein [Pseudomonas]MCH4874707.1 citrate lyase [Pseudomonas sp. TMW22091]TWR87077.1 HpcH/HpaI aldolase/citrate lyase family protein [Pseudomonas saxonica]WRQ76348.1 HpcH/HpaI aldolase/citrate lyase family protein [Pseudomonas saxonica]